MLVTSALIALAFWPARVARRKGHSFWRFFIFSLVLFPAALIVAYRVKERPAPAGSPVAYVLDSPPAT